LALITRYPPYEKYFGQVQYKNMDGLNFDGGSTWDADPPDYATMAKPGRCPEKFNNSESSRSYKAL
jgi:hypothetical protein